MGQTNLPTSLTSFVGRNSERADLRPLLSGSRLVTLTGSGGVGKTRLALELAHERIDSNPDGVWFVDVTLVSDGGLIPDVAAEAESCQEPERTGDSTDILITPAERPQEKANGAERAEGPDRV